VRYGQYSRSLGVKGLKNEHSLLREHLCMVKVKVDPGNIMKAYEGVAIRHHMFLISAIDVGGWTASCPSCLTAKERATSTHRIGGEWNSGRV